MITDSNRQEYECHDKHETAIDVNMSHVVVMAYSNEAGVDIRAQCVVVQLRQFHAVYII